MWGVFSGLQDMVVFVGFRLWLRLLCMVVKWFVISVDWLLLMGMGVSHVSD